MEKILQKDGHVDVGDGWEESSTHGNAGGLMKCLVGSKKLFLMLYANSCMIKFGLIINKCW